MGRISNQNRPEKDHVDMLLGQWQQQRPDLDVSPMAVFTRLLRLTSKSEPLLKELYKDYGIIMPDFDVLATLRRAAPEQGLKPTALYTQSLLSSGAMTNRIDRLEKAGLVERVPDPEDRRALFVQLTPQGRALIDQVLPDYLGLLEEIIAPLAPDEREILATLLRKINLDGLEG